MKERHPSASSDFIACNFSILRASLAGASAIGLILVAGCEMGPKRPPLESKPVVLDLNREELTQPYAKAFGDMNGDSLPDILIGELNGPIFAFRYPGVERFTLNDKNGGDDLAIADINADGRPDFVSNGQQVAWYENLGDSSSYKERVLLYGRRTHDLAAEDINKDGKIDIITHDEKNGLSYLLVQESPEQWTEVQLVNALGGVGTAVADMDGDGRLDVLGSGYYLRQGDDPRAPGAWTRVMVTTWPAPSAVRGEDIDKDGKVDMILAAAYQDYHISWFRNPGPRASEDTSYWSENVIANGVSHVHRFHLADVDKNGTRDIVFAEQHQSRLHRVGVLLNKDGNGNAWTMKLLDDKGAHNIAIADVGNDGNLEVLAVNWAGDTRIRLLTDLLKDAGQMSISPRLLSGGNPAPSTKSTAIAGNATD